MTDAQDLLRMRREFVMELQATPLRDGRTRDRLEYEIRRIDNLIDGNITPRRFK